MRRWNDEVIVWVGKICGGVAEHRLASEERAMYWPSSKVGSLLPGNASRVTQLPRMDIFMMIVCPEDPVSEQGLARRRRAWPDFLRRKAAIREEW